MRTLFDTEKKTEKNSVNVSNWSTDFGSAETGNGAKKRVVSLREIFSL